ncbi:unnamed protein product [Rotaria magnacalcarata]|uniref:Uncharacterized protein n=1 Tax=Rotaria magnacalcarata TaxID=392030 RepID=A0A816Q8Q7_9BILA|nr:unnamed protein product [Rotaria magnacalcarata]CAF1222720.1 unnamed protein product [Rotaria magnacalcarata]CAF2056883.1 unnamed protein product [Rotaria magnacalcarata]CAF3882394.1 unnamed protein product [Rotaria magnacalcarata]CAF4001229.1 unnamed protein product [Rotaria magnacalcarata]
MLNFLKSKSVVVFHLSQNIQRFLQTHGFKQRYETDIVFADNVHKIWALTFLEPNQVINGFELLCSDLGDEYQEIFHYIEDNYIGRARGRSRWPATFPIHFWNMATRVKNNMQLNKQFDGSMAQKVELLIPMYAPKLMDVYK